MKPLCVAHRGCHWKCFENTKQAFEAATKGKFFGIEMDIHLTKDKKWIVHHDPDFLSNGKKVVIKDEKFNDLIKMPLDNKWGYEAKCPSLEEYLKIVKTSNKRPVIEIKPKNPSFHNLKKVIKEVKKYYDLKDVTFIAFYPWPLMKIKIMHPKQDVQLLVEHTHPFLVDWAYKFRWGLDIESPMLTKSMCKKFQEKGLVVNAWTVDTKKELKRLCELNIDMITTNVFDQNS